MSETRQLTLTDKKKLEAELAELIEAKKRVAEDIQTARGFGDLSENAEYDAAKAKEILGWEAKYDMVDMCRDAWHWQKNNPNGYRKG